MVKENERKCLKTIIEAYCYKTSCARINFDNGDCRWLSRVLRNAKETGNDNTFPDFVSDGAIIEHFQVTSTKEGKKGSAYMAERSRKNAEREKGFEKRTADFLNSSAMTPSITTHAFENEYRDLSYDFFLKSVETNFKQHIKSLEKSGIADKKVVFIMEQCDARLCKKKTADFCEYYLLHEDRKALGLLKRYAHQVDIVIFKAIDSIEIIDLSKIDFLSENGIDLPDVKPGTKIDGCVEVYIDMGRFPFPKN